MKNFLIGVFAILSVSAASASTCKLRLTFCQKGWPACSMSSGYYFAPKKIANVEDCKALAVERLETTLKSNRNILKKGYAKYNFVDEDGSVLKEKILRQTISLH